MAFSLQFSEGLIVQVGSLSGISQVVLGLSEFGQVQSSNFFCFFDLLLVALDLSLERVNQSLHAFVVLAVFISSEGQFLNAALRASQVLGSICEASAFSIQFRLELANASVHLVHCLLASFEGISFCGVQTSLQVLSLAIKQFLVLFKSLCNFLFSALFIFKGSLSLTDLGVVYLDALLGFNIGSVGVFK